MADRALPPPLAVVPSLGIRLDTETPRALAVGAGTCLPVSGSVEARHGRLPPTLLLDGEAPGASHGVDVDEGGNGVLRDGRMYQLVRQHDAVRERTLEITFLEPGAAAYVFTLG